MQEVQILKGLHKAFAESWTHRYSQDWGFHWGPFVLPTIYDKDKSNSSISQAKFGGNKRKTIVTTHRWNRSPVLWSHSSQSSKISKLTFLHWTLRYFNYAHDCIQLPWGRQCSQMDSMQLHLVNTQNCRQPWEARFLHILYQNSLKRMYVPSVF